LFVQVSVSLGFVGRNGLGRNAGAGKPDPDALLIDPFAQPLAPLTIAMLIPVF
jgi:hypothetical protein